MKVISFCNHKGGVGKTTSAASIGVCMARQGKRVLLVDLDGQANLTGIFVKDDIESSIYNAIVEKAQMKAREEGARIITEAKAQIEAEKQNAIADIRKQVAELSVQVAEKVLRKELSSDAAQMQYVDKLLDEVSSNAN